MNISLIGRQCSWLKRRLNGQNEKDNADVARGE
jgi:hypothetical protein